MKCSAPPKELEQLLRIVNLAPMSYDFPSDEDLINEYKSLTGCEVYKDFISNLQNKDFFWFVQERVKEICEPFPSLLNHVDFNNQGTPSEYQVDVSTEYLMFLRARRDLKSLMTLGKNTNTIFTDSSVPSNYFIHSCVKNGVFVFELTPFAEALQGIPINRISTCPICQTIFWVSRRDMHCCRSKCSVLHRMREYRKRKRIAETEKRNQRRQDRHRRTASFS